MKASSSCLLHITVQHSFSMTKVGEKPANAAGVTNCVILHINFGPDRACGPVSGLR
jgi:hypothetical protein